MRTIVVAGLLMMALFVAVLTAVNAECPKRAPSIADGVRPAAGPAG